MTSDSTTRFSNRVEDYKKFRPAYPAEAIEVLLETLPPAPDHVVADIGSGTGILTRQLLDAGHRVIAVEPNRDMAAVAVSELGERATFTQQIATAESTGLGDHSINLITMAQAFHWIDPVAARTEFTRILKPRSAVALIWNERSKYGSDFDREYEKLLQEFSTDYNRVDHTVVAAEKMREFWRGDAVEKFEFPNAQQLDRAGLHGRVASSSYTPPAGAPRFAELHGRLDELFDRHHEADVLRIDYVTRIYVGVLSEKAL